MTRYRLKQYIAGLATTLYLLCFSSLTASAHVSFVAAAGDASKQATCDTIQNISSDVSCGGDSGSSLSDLVASVLEILSVIAGVIAVIMIIVSGFKYITASGDANNTKSAKNALIYAIVGLVIVTLAQAIVHFVLGRAGE